MNQTEKARTNSKVIPFPIKGKEDLTIKNQNRLASAALVVYLFFRDRNTSVSFEMCEELALFLLERKES